MTSAHVIVPVALLDVGTYELAVYCALLAQSTVTHTPTTAVSHRQLAAATRISTSRTKKALDELRDAGWIDWATQTAEDGGCAPHIYTIHHTPGVRA